MYLIDEIHFILNICKNLHKKYIMISINVQPALNLRYL